MAKLPAKKGLPAEVIELPGGQAALFEDPRELLKLAPAELDELAHAFGKAGGGALRQLKRAFGLICWAKRHQLDEGQYGQWLEDYTVVVGVDSSATLRRWRDAVEKRDNLPIPVNYQQRQREAQSRRSTPVRIQNVPDPPLPVPPAQPAQMRMDRPPPEPHLTPPVPAALAQPNGRPVDEDTAPAVVRRVVSLLQWLAEPLFQELSQAVKAEANRRRDLRTGDPGRPLERRQVEPRFKR